MFLVLLIVLVAPTRAARAGAWLPEPGAVYTKSSLLLLRADTRRVCGDPDAPVSEFGGTYREVQLFGYAEIGLHPRVAGLVSWAWKDTRLVDASVPEFGTRSTGDLRLGARWGLLRLPVPVSVETIVGLPTYPRSDPRDLVSRREQFLPAGTGHVEWEINVQTGVSLYPWPLYANVMGGRRERGGAFGDLWLLALEVGAAFERVFLKSDWRAVSGDGDPCASASAGAVSLQERSWHWAPEMAFRVAPHWWVGAGASVLLGGRNVLDGTQWSLAVTWQRPG